MSNKTLNEILSELRFHINMAMETVEDYGVQVDLDVQTLEEGKEATMILTIKNDEHRNVRLQNSARVDMIDPDAVGAHGETLMGYSLTDSEYPYVVKSGEAGHLYHITKAYAQELFPREKT